MGAKKAPLPIVEDFNLVVRFFQVKGVLPDEPDAVILDYGRRIHGVTYSLIWWRFRLRGLKQCGKVFIEELASDALQILPQAFMGYNKASKLLIRGVIENVWR